MKRAALAFLFLSLLTGSVRAAQSQSAPPSTQVSSPANPAPAAAEPQEKPKITEYTLPPDLHRKAHFKSRGQFAFRLFSFAYSLFVLWLILRRRWSARFRDWAESVSRFRFFQGLVFTAFLVVTISIFQLPLDIFQQCMLKLYRISVQPWLSWTRDWLVALALTAVIGGFFVIILYGVIRRSPRLWWLYFWMLSLPLLLFGVFISPYVIDPLFNKFEPLSAKAPELIAPLQTVARRAGMEIPAERMFWMRASDKATYSNAYVTGFGASKRIVIWDTAIEQETRDGLLVTFGHELGHYALNHVWKGFLFGAALLFVLAWLGSRTIGSMLARSGAVWSIRGLADWASLPALLFLLTLFGFAASAAGNTFSRYVENQADIYGLEVAHGIVADPGQAAAASFQMYGERTAVDPDPPVLDVWLYFDHPPVRDRIHLFVTYDPWSPGHSPQFVK